MRLVDELTPPLRIKILVGDVFAYSIHGVFRYLRVINDIDAVGHGRVVLYFYDSTSPVMESVPKLEKEHLILPPVMTWREVLRDGFSARVLKGIESEPFDRWPTHCFDSEGTSFGPYCDEFGNRLPDRLEPCGSWGMPTSFYYLEYLVGSKLGLLSSYAEHETMPELPRPLLRKARKGKLPNARVSIVLPDFTYEKFEHLVATKYSSDSQDSTGMHGIIGHEIYRTIQAVPGFSSVAIQSWPNLDSHQPRLNMTVKKRQHEEFYQKIAEGLKRLGIEKYYVQDAELHDWLAGTYKPADHKPL
jgi:hypothetical protein